MSDERRLAALTCDEREALMGDYSAWSVYSTITDPDGQYGKPLIMTLWGPKAGPNVVLGVRDLRHPDPRGGADVAPCEHYAELIDWRPER